MQQPPYPPGTLPRLPVDAWSLGLYQAWYVLCFSYIQACMIKFNSQIRHGKRLTATINNKIERLLIIYCNKSPVNVVSFCQNTFLYRVNDFSILTKHSSWTVSTSFAVRGAAAKLPQTSFPFMTSWLEGSFLLIISNHSIWIFLLLRTFIFSLKEEVFPSFSLVDPNWQNPCSPLWGHSLVMWGWPEHKHWDTPDNHSKATTWLTGGTGWTRRRCTSREGWRRTLPDFVTLPRRRI